MKNLKYNLEAAFISELKRIFNIEILEDGDIIKDVHTGIILIDVDLIYDRIDFAYNGKLQALEIFQFMDFMNKKIGM